MKLLKGNLKDISSKKLYICTACLVIIYITVFIVPIATHRCPELVTHFIDVFKTLSSKKLSY